MADKIPVKARYSGSDVISLGELEAGDTIAASYINGLVGEVTGTGGATVIADNVVDEANLKVSNSPTNGYALTAQSGNTGGLTWASVGGGGGSGAWTVTSSGVVSGTSTTAVLFQNIAKPVMLIMSDWHITTSNYNNMSMQYSINNGSNWFVGNEYRNIWWREGTAAVYNAEYYGGETNATYAPMEQDYTGVDSYFSGIYTMLEPHGTRQDKVWRCDYHNYGYNNKHVFGTSSGIVYTHSAINCIQFNNHGHAFGGRYTMMELN